MFMLRWSFTQERCVCLFIQVRVLLILVHLWTFHFFTVPYFSLDRRDRTLTLQGGYFGFKCTAPILEISIKSTYGGGGKDGLGVGEKYIFSFFLASLPHRYKPQGPPRPLGRYENKMAARNGNRLISRFFPEKSKTASSLLSIFLF